MRTIAIIPHETSCRTVLVVTYNPEWEEYIVTPVVDGAKDKKARYHTDDEEDARNTARVMARDYQPA
jgi:Mg-chelatase subunit ChlI